MTLISMQLILQYFGCMANIIANFNLMFQTSSDVSPTVVVTGIVVG